MELIERHHTKFIEKQAYYKSCVFKTIEKLEQSYLQAFETNHSTVVGGNMISILSEFNEYCIGEGQDRGCQIKLLKYWQILAKAYYTLAYNVGKEVEITFRDKPIKTQGRPFTSYMGFNKWIDAWSVFWVLRDRQGIELMLSAKDDDFKRADVEAFGLDFKLLDIFRSIYGTDKDIQNIFIEAMNATDPESGMFNAPAGTRYVLYLIEPLIRVYYALLRRHEADFNTVLHEALRLHKEYWGSTENNRNNSSDGWISWLLLAPASLAYDFGMKVEVESDYIPRWLVEGNFTVPEK